ncbi:sodium:solute symporter family transporter [Chitinophaga sp. MM2321]|uniref:sodium:solute symporter family transporter n=1 Tax=Chitinophaga sp. MM2321 TaxID=3137178 RepID=UPI0032D56A1D
MNFRYFLFALVICCSPLLLAAQLQKQLKWEALPSAPVKEGFAGMYAGVSNNVMLSMGGADLVDGAPAGAVGGKSYDHIYILSEKSGSWKMAAEKLPKPMAYGASFSYKEEIILVGGRDQQQYYPDVYTVSYNKGKITSRKLAALPFPLADLSGAVVGDYLFIAGGEMSAEGLPAATFLALDLRSPAAQQQWTTLEAWPGPARMLAVGATMHNDFFLFSGIEIPAENGAPRVLTDAYRFTPAFTGNKLSGGKWQVVANMPQGVAGAPSPAPTVGLNHILFPVKGQSQGDSTAAGTNLMAYNAEANKWLDFGKLSSLDISLGNTAVKWNSEWVVMENNKAAGQDSIGIFTLSKNLGFGWINWITLVVYLGLMLWIGFIYDKRGQTTDNFFTAGGKIPWWAAGLSIYGTQISAITFMAIPAIVFATDWTLAIGSVLILATVPIVAKYYIPFFRRVNVTSAYEYLEHRFSPNVRLFGSLSFIFFQMGRMGIVLYLPAVAIAAVTGIDIYLLVVIMGVICIIYTVMGGIEAVVWTDVAQVVILMGGAAVCFLVAVFNVKGGFQSVFDQGMAADKFALFQLGWKPDSLVLWVCIVGFFFLNIIPYTSDQAIVQRYLTVKDEKQAAKSLWVNAWITLPGTVIFFGLGTVLYVFYHDNPGIIASDKVDEILPYFVVQQLPVGISGLVIAGIFAASQSTLSSSMNSISATFFSDIYQRFRPVGTDKNTLMVARQATVIAGIFGTASALAIAALDVQFIFDLFQEVLGILGGSLAGVFILGIFTNRANTTGVISGLIAGVVIVWVVRSETTISVYLYGAISVMSCVIIGYLASFLSPQQKDITGLSYSSLKALKAKVQSGKQVVVL